MGVLSEPRHDAIDLSEHAVARYRERRRPALALTAARAELARLAAHGEIRRDPPDWTRTASPKPFYLVIAGTFALPLAAQRGRWVTDHLRGQAGADSARAIKRFRRRARDAAAKHVRRRTAG
jgi:hypothetical protein